VTLTVQTYSCNAGYTLTGPATTTCQTSSTWSALPPAVSCVGIRFNS